jgi:hypothetical protein
MAHQPIPETLYVYHPTTYLGVFMPESVMVEIDKLGLKYGADVRQVLAENKDRLYAAEILLAFPDGHQTVVYFASKDGVEERIAGSKNASPTWSGGL